MRTPLSAAAEPLPPQHTPLGAPGLYIQTLLPGSPAAADGRLSLGDRILEVNGSSLAGVSYLRYPHPAPRTPHGPGVRAGARGRSGQHPRCTHVRDGAPLSPLPRLASHGQRRPWALAPAHGPPEAAP